MVDMGEASKQSEIRRIAKMNREEAAAAAAAAVATEINETGKTD
jgi:hypothetical protein